MEFKEELKFLRQGDVLRPSRDLIGPIVIIGAGAVGSVTAYLLASLGCLNVTVYDDDSVEVHNTAYSFYPDRFVGQKKVAALRKVLKYFKGSRVSKWKFIDERFSDQTLQKNCLVIVAVDNMDTRIDLWNRRFKNNADVAFLMEGRMAFETYYLYTIRPYHSDDIRFYEQHLYPQSEAHQGSCGQRSIVYTVHGLAQEIAANLKKIAKGEDYSREIIREYSSATFIVNP